MKAIQYSLRRRLLVFALLFSTSSFATKCKLGEIVDPPYSPVVPNFHPGLSTPERKVGLIREGRKTFTFLVKDFEKSPHVEKQYKDRSKFSKEERGYRILESVTKKVDARYRFKLLTRLHGKKPHSLFYQSLFFDWVPGRALSEVLADPRVAPEIKRALYEDYRIRLQATSEALKKVFPGYLSSARTRSTLVGTQTMELAEFLIASPDYATQLWLRVDQVIVKFNEKNPRQFELYLVDSL